MTKIDFFKGEHQFLSNFYPCTVLYDGEAYRTAEHAFQAAKSFWPSVRLQIRILPTPSAAKRYGRGVHLREDWEDVKIGIMYVILLDKFTRNEDLRRKLFETGYAPLIEGNPWGDKFWGKVDGEGSNHLGELLMQIREVLGG